MNGLSSLGIENDRRVFCTDHAKVSEFDPTAGRVAQKDVLWFDVSVDKSERVQVGQSATELRHHPLTTILLHTDLKKVQQG